MSKARPLAVCFDLTGVLVDHRDLSPLPGMVQLVKDLHAGGIYIAIITKHEEQRAKEILGEELCRFICNIYSAPGGGQEKHRRVVDFASECGISDLSRVVFVDDKPENLAAVAGSGV